MNGYHNAIKQAVNYIEENLHADCRLADISRSVHLSEAHFSRIFAAMTGERLGDYLRRRRLAEAAQALLETEQTILAIAIAYQYESQEAFSRSFKAAYGMMPGEFRRRGIRPYMILKRHLTGAMLEHRVMQSALQPDIRHLAHPITVVGTTGTTCLRDNQIPAIWAEFQRRYDEISYAVTGAAYGISIHQPRLAMHEFTADTEYVEITGCEVAPPVMVPDGMVSYTIEPGWYAVFVNKGPATTILYTYQYILGTWLTHTPYERDSRPCFEQYGTDYYGPEHPESIARIFIPLAKHTFES